VRSGSISLVVPILDEEPGLGELHRRLTEVLGGIGAARELLLVDDGSRDGSFRAITALAAVDPSVRGLRLARNAGSQQALLVGLRAARGDAIITLDADLQHPPEQLPSMIAAWRAGADVVEMRRRNPLRQGALRDLLTPAFYRLFNVVSAVPLSPRSTDFRLLDRRCVAGLRGRPGELVRAQVARLDAPRVLLDFDVPPRFAGESRYDLARLARTASAALGLGATAAPVEVVAEVGRGLPPCE
jgi:dolichol-phosphate mannosyltransferase